MKPAKLSQVAMAAMIAARGTTAHQPLVKRLFVEAKQHYNLPLKYRLKAEIDDKTSPMYGVLIRKTKRWSGCTPRYNGQTCMVADHLVPEYVFGPKFVSVSKADAVAILQTAARDFGTDRGAGAPTGTAGWGGTYVSTLGNEASLVVPVGSTFRALPMADVLAMLAMLGTPVDAEHTPAGFGGVLVTDTDLLIPA